MIKPTASVVNSSSAFETGGKEKKNNKERKDSWLKNVAGRE